MKPVTDLIKGFEQGIPDKPEISTSSISNRIKNFEALDAHAQKTPPLLLRQNSNHKQFTSPTQNVKIDDKFVKQVQITSPKLPLKKTEEIRTPVPPPPPPLILMKTKPKVPPPPPKSLLQKKQLTDENTKKNETKHMSQNMEKMRNKLEKKLGTSNTIENNEKEEKSSSSILTTTWQATLNVFRRKDDHQSGETSNSETNIDESTTDDTQKSDPDESDILLANKIQWVVDKLLSHDGGASNRIKSPLLPSISDTEESLEYIKQTWTNVEVKDYFPEIFRSIRANIEGGGTALADAICNNVLQVVCSPGKSGALLLFSQDKDKKFVIKSTTQSESRVLRNMIHAYNHHIRTYTTSLLPKFYAHFRFSHEGKVHYALIMNNHFAAMDLDTKFDLKGSFIGRRASAKDKQSRLFKDLDLIDMKVAYQLEKNMRIMIMKQLELDTKFLIDHQIMDYSLLVGISKRRMKCNPLEINRFNFGSDTIAIGIIDILCVWNMYKLSEMVLRSTYSDSSKISPVPPKTYAERLVSFVGNQFFPPEDLRSK
jgi:hypothetical protein